MQEEHNAIKGDGSDFLSDKKSCELCSYLTKSECILLTLPDGQTCLINREKQVYELLKLLIFYFDSFYSMAL